MNVAATQWAIERPDLQQTARNVLIVLARSSDLSGLCTMSKADLAGMAGVNGSTVDTFLNALELQGFIRCRRDSDEAAAASDACTFKLMFPEAHRHFLFNPSTAEDWI